MRLRPLTTHCSAVCQPVLFIGWTLEVIKKNFNLLAGHETYRGMNMDFECTLLARFTWCTVKMCSLLLTHALQPLCSVHDSGYWLEINLDMFLMIVGRRARKDTKRTCKLYIWEQELSQGPSIATPQCCKNDYVPKSVLVATISQCQNRWGGSK